MQQNPLANFRHKDFEIKTNKLCEIINQFRLDEGSNEKRHTDFLRNTDSEIEKLSTLSDGIYSKVKENELGFYIKIIVDRNKLGNEFKSQSSLPECITFLMIVDYSFPSQPPKILSKTNVLIYLIKWL